jgi:hypothetical protein
MRVFQPPVRLFYPFRSVPPCSREASRLGRLMSVRSVGIFFINPALYDCSI